MQDTPSSTLRRRRAQLLRQMPALDTLLRGSLIERYKRCGKPGCKCADGPGHGPKYYLSVSFPGRRPQMDYVPQADHVDITERLELPPGPRDHRRDLRDQSRTIAPPRGVLRGIGEPAATAAHPLLHRSAIGRRTHRQHARVLAERRLRAGSDQGDRR